MVIQMSKQSEGVGSEMDTKHRRLTLAMGWGTGMLTAAGVAAASYGGYFGYSVAVLALLPLFVVLLTEIQYSLDTEVIFNE
jgi:hypothetical protein